MPAPDISAILGISGPLFAAIGAGLLAYDALQGPMQAHRQRKFQTRAEGVLSIHRYLSTTYPSPPYSADEVSEVKAKLEKERDDKLAQLQAESAASDIEYRLLVSNLAFWGFLLVAIGSLAQGAAAWITW